MAQAEQDQLTRQVGRSLLTVAGEGWQRVRAEYRSAGRHVEVDVFVTGADGVENLVRPPQEVVEGLGRLRQGMYRPGRGTWLSGLYVLEPPSSFSAEFEPDVEPRWRRVPPPIGFADELRFFPRADEHIPEWLRQRAGLPPLKTEDAPQGGQPTPPRGVPGNQPPAGHGGAPGGQRPGEPTPPPGNQFGGQPTPPPGIPGGRGNETPRPGNQFSGQQTPPPGIPFGGRQSEPTPPPGTPSSGQGGETPPGGNHFGGQPTPPPGNQFSGQPGMPF